MPERLQKVLAARGVASRRAAEELIRSGQVAVNGAPATVGQSVDPERDVVAVLGSVVTIQRPIYLAFHKPSGVVTSLRSTHGEQTVRDVVQVPGSWHPVGRLDKESKGLLLLTNDGVLTNIVTHPRYGVEKEYRVRVKGHPPDSRLEQLTDGIHLAANEATAPARVARLSGGSSDTTLSITVIEGHKRQIRRMLGVIGHPVLDLCRVRIGSVPLDGLGPGVWRDLTESEVRSLLEHERGGPARGGTAGQAAHRH